ncbi:MAG: DedA family protein [Deltaproteobacteria bacterium]|nr:DedA family protein [Deltaproteobacteria bacterium]
MPSLSDLIGHWGYLAIFLAVVLGNMGVPVPEEAILLLAGYLVWEGELWLPAVLFIGIVSAAGGDNLGYWLGRRFGQAVMKRYREWLFLKAEKFESMQQLVARYGPTGVFCARFLPGLRFLAGPLAGTVGLPFLPFFIANILGAVLYVPLAVGAGLAIGYGFGAHVAKLERIIGKVEYVVLIAAFTGTVVIVFWRAVRTRRVWSREE